MLKNDSKSYWEKRLSVPDLGIEHVGHTGLGYAYNYWLYMTRYASMERAVRNLNVPIKGKKLLEMGVGSGAWTSYWQSHGIKELTGVDITAASVKHLRSKYPQFSFFQADITQDVDMLQGKLFDFVTAFDVLFHIIDDSGFHNSIINMMRHLKSGGYAIISDSFCRKPWGPTSHEYHRSFNQYILEFQGVGLEPIHIEPIFFTMTTPLCAKKSFPLITYSRFISTNLRVIRKIASNSKTEKVNNIFGFFLSTIDRILGSLLPTGPSLKILFVRKT